MDLGLLTTQTVITFLLILFRVSGMMLTAPFFNGHGIPQQSKIGLAFTVTLLLFPFHSTHFVVPTDLIQFAVVGAQELVIGLLLGFVADLAFVSLQMAGDFVSTQVGLSMTSVLDPMSGVQMPVIGHLYFYFGMLLFLSLNMHHALILALNHSFDVLPLGHFVDPGHGHTIGQLTERFLWLGGQMFGLSMMLGAPVLGILLVTEVALGFVNKMMPQMNVFMVSMPLKITVGLATMAFCLPYVGDVLQKEFSGMYAHLKVLFH